MIEIKENTLDLNTYLSLRASVHWKLLTQEQAKKALLNSLYTITAINQGESVSMGRIVGYGAVICYIQDLIVKSEYQGQ